MEKCLLYIILSLGVNKTHNMYKRYSPLLGY